MDNALKDAGVWTATNAMNVPFTGNGVLIGVVDTGFDLSHPMFRDGHGNLRVEGMLDQTVGGGGAYRGVEYDTNQLTTGWSSGVGQGHDSNGHGTHVASIAGGSTYGGLQGVAPDAHFLLVKSDFVNIDLATRWIFDRAGTRPCVVNLSLGHHFGSHDGSEASERVYEGLSGPGKIIVAAAGNEQRSNIHIGDRFGTGEQQTARFDLIRQRNGSAYVYLTLWYNNQDRFDVELITPMGARMSAPPLGRSDLYQGPHLDIEIGKKRYSPTGLKQVQIKVEFTGGTVSDQWLENWGLMLTCKRAVVGRIDGWFHNSGFARFRQSALVEHARTIGMPATSRGVLSVASHITRDRWDSDAGQQRDFNAVIGRNSPFSSRGPTRDGREKPELSAPGQYITAALGEGSGLAGAFERADSANRLVSIEGTSMATPVVAGAIALMLEKTPNLTADQIRAALPNATDRDAHTGASNWTPAYGYGKLNVQKVLNAV